MNNGQFMIKKYSITYTSQFAILTVTLKQDF